MEDLTAERETASQAAETEAAFPVEEPKGRGALMLLAAIFFAAAYLFLSIVPISTAPLGFLVLAFAVFAVTAIMALRLGGRIRPSSVIAFVFALGVAAFRFIHGSFGDDFTANKLFPSFTLTGLAYAYFVITLFGNGSGTLGGRFLLDICKAAAYLFVSFGEVFKTAFGRRKKRSSGTLAVVIGVIVAAVLLVIVGSLLSYDENFSAMLPKIDLDSLPVILRKIVLAVPLCAMMFSLFFASRANKFNGLSSEGSRAGISNTIRFIPALILIIPAFALLALYVMFFISQWSYYVGAFTHKLPDGLSAAGYAREGFFQLLAVACVNAGLLVGLGCFTKRKNGAEDKVCKAASVLFCIATLVLIATAVAKMLLYIDLYDLTYSRLAATIFLVFLAAAFVIEVFALIIKRMKALPFVIAVGLVMVFAFSLVNTEKLIADYNVDAYLSGKHRNIDVEYLRDDIGINALDALYRLRTEATDGKVVKEALSASAAISRDMNARSVPWYRYDIPYLRESAKE